MSNPPNPPGMFEATYIFFPSADKLGVSTEYSAGTAFKFVMLTHFLGLFHLNLLYVVCKFDYYLGFLM